MAREFIVEASLSVLRRGGIGKPIFLQSNYHIRKIYSLESGFAIQIRLVNPSKGLGQKNGLKGPKVSAVIPEAGRSIPGQDEVVRKDDGGLQ